MRILLISEEITSSPSEGLLVFTMHICRYLAERHEVTLLHKTGSPDPALESYPLLSGRFHFSIELRRFYRERDFDLIIYIPSSGITAMGMIRSNIIRISSSTPLMLIGLQSRTISAVHRYAALFRPPDIILSPVSRMRKELDEYGYHTEYIMPGFDERLFKPAELGEKIRLRKKYGFPENKFLVLHVGHIKESRNLQTFLRYRDWGNDILPVIKGGEVDPTWRNRLRMAGIIVIDEYTDDIHELYQACDLYLFPVSSNLGALEFPLSVIEAAACNLPTLTTRFGALPEILKESEGYLYYDESTEIREKIRTLRKSRPETSHLVSKFSWNNVFDRFLEPHFELLLKKKERQNNNDL
ncbi:MAG: glycosyltransferase family 4 protein [Candidatus Krumholzibacteriota bacterium]|nr:glycosyltransferase family 4 protein [Candidatus Krumholzibacteriota bacterium]